MKEWFRKTGRWIVVQLGITLAALATIIILTKRYNAHRSRAELDLLVNLPEKVRNDHKAYLEALDKKTEELQKMDAQAIADYFERKFGKGE